MYIKRRAGFIILCMCIHLVATHAQTIKVGIGHNGAVSSLVPVYNGELVASGSSDGTIKIWESLTGREIRTIAGHEDQVTSMATNPDGMQLVTCSRDNTTRLWDILTGREIWTYKGDDASFAVAFHPGGKLIATADYDKIRIIDAGNGKLIRTFSGHYYWIRGLVFSPDGKRLYSCSDDERIIAWNVQTGAAFWTKKAHKNAMASFLLSHDGKQLYSSSKDKSLKVWDTDSGRLLKRWEKNTPVFSTLVLDETGTILFAGDSGGTIWRLDLSSDAGPVQVKNLGKAISSMKLIAEDTLLTGFSNAQIGEYSIQENEITKQYGAGIGQVLDLSLAGNVPFLSAALSDGSVALWNYETVNLQGLDVISSAVPATALSPDGKIVAYSNNRGEIFIRDTEKNTLVWTFKEHKRRVNGLHISPDGTRLLSGSSDGTIGFWDLGKGQLIKLFTGPIGEVMDVQFAPSGEAGIAGDVHNEIFLLDLKKLRLSSPLHINNYGVTSVSLSPDAQTFVSTAIDQLDSTKNNVHVWDRVQGKQLFTVSGHTDGALASGFSFDGKLIATGGNDNLIRLWDASTGRSAGILSGHNNSVTGVSFLDKQNRIVSSSKDGMIKIWDPGGNVVASFLCTKEGEWLIWTEEGFFTGTDWAMKHMVYIVDGVKTYSIDQFFEIFYRPDLVAATIAGRDITTLVPDINIRELLQNHGRPPLVEIISPVDGEARLRKVKVRCKVTGQGGGIGSVRISINGTPVIISGDSGKGLSVVSRDESPQKKRDANIEFEATLTLQRGANTIIVTAYNKMNTIESSPAHLTLRLGKIKVSKPRLHLLTIAVEKYRDRALLLKYTVDDAKALVQALENQDRQTGGLYESVHIYTLLDEQVTKDEFTSIFDKISKNIRPDDVFILFFSGHGVTYDTDGEYYFLPVNFRYRNSESIVEQGISKEDIIGSIAKVPAQKSVILFDTCHSGAFLDKPLARGLSEKTAIDRLLRGVGRAMIMAAADDQVALEGYENHGVFSYILLQGIGGKADVNDDNYITIKELSLYIESTVPDVTYNKWGYEQVPQSHLPKQDFPVVVK